MGINPPFSDQSQPGPDLDKWILCSFQIEIRWINIHRSHIWTRSINKSILTKWILKIFLHIHAYMPAYNKTICIYLGIMHLTLDFGKWRRPTCNSREESPTCKSINPSRGCNFVRVSRIIGKAFIHQSESTPLSLSLHLLLYFLVG